MQLKVIGIVIVKENINSSMMVVVCFQSSHTPFLKILQVTVVASFQSSHTPFLERLQVTIKSDYIKGNRGNNTKLNKDAWLHLKQYFQ